jgi:hypothetical protein
MSDTQGKGTPVNGEPDDTLLVRYLSGGCSEAEKARVEEAFFADDDVFARMLQIEEDLIERHTRGELQEHERESVRAAYASPPRRERVMFARSLQRLLGAAEVEAGAVTGQPPPPASNVRPWPRIVRSRFGITLAAAAMVTAVVGALVLAWQANGLRSSVQSIQADNETLRQQRDAARRRIEELEGRAATLSTELDRERATRAAGSQPRARTVVATFVLTPGLLRSARAAARLAIAPSIDEVRLQLDLEPGIEAARFRAELRDIDARVVWTQDGLSAISTGAGGAVLVTLPATLLPAGAQEVVLLAASGSRFEEAARYYFDVVRE